MESQALTDVLAKVGSGAAALGPLVTTVSTVITGLKADVAAGMSPAEQVTVVASLQTVADALAAAGAALTALSPAPV
jgi:hypothetical protein